MLVSPEQCVQLGSIVLSNIARTVMLVTVFKYMLCTKTSVLCVARKVNCF